MRPIELTRRYMEIEVKNLVKKIESRKGLEHLDSGIGLALVHAEEEFEEHPIDPITKVRT